MVGRAGRPCRRAGRRRGRRDRPLARLRQAWPRRPRGTLLEGPTSRCAPASWSASPESPATANWSSTRCPRACAARHRAPWTVSGALSGARRRRPRPAPSACPRTRSPTPSSRARRARARRASTCRPQVRKRLGIDWRGSASRLGERNEATSCGADRQPPGGLAVGRQHPAGHADPLPRRRRLARRRRLPEPGPRHRHHRRTQELLLERRADGAGVLLISRTSTSCSSCPTASPCCTTGASRASSTPGRPTATRSGRLMLGGRHRRRRRATGAA